jgi:hypothetical protein
MRQRQPGWLAGPDWHGQDILATSAAMTAAPHSSEIHGSNARGARNADAPRKLDIMLGSF